MFRINAHRRDLVTLNQNRAATAVTDGEVGCATRSQTDTDANGLAYLVNQGITPVEERIHSSGDPEQLAWINETLATSKADWNLVIGHFPVYSATTGEVRLFRAEA